MERKHALDNLRFLLILAVVVGHLLEITAYFEGKTLLYRIIYSFHMPAFLFLTGYFAKFKPKRILCGYVLPYILFQPLYIWFCSAVLHIDLPYQYTTPYWLLWYLLACIFYLMLIPLIDAKSPKLQWAILIGAVALSLLVGYENTIGYYGSFSRFFVFLPWFLLGFYFRKNEAFFTARSKALKGVGIVLCAAVAVGSVFYLNAPHLVDNMLYGSYPYEALNYSPIERGLFLIIALGWVGLLYAFCKKALFFKIPLLSSIGKNTLPIFLLHGFIMKALPIYAPNWLQNPLYILPIALAVLLVLGNPLIGRLFRFVFNDLWELKRH